MKPTLRQRFRYYFDNLMSRGTPAMIFILFMLSLAVVFTAGVILTLTHFAQTNDSPLALGEAIWESLMRTLDPGTMGTDTGMGFRAVMLFVTLGGIFIVSALIGVLNNAIQERMNHLRKGRSLVLESNHTIILGWSTQVFTILSELMIANENQKNVRVVVMADMDKVAMEDEIRNRVEVLGSTRIICRSGNPIDLNDLEIVSPHTAKSIIILPPEDQDSDTVVLKTVLAITNDPNRREGPYHIVTQLRNEKNMDLVKMIGERDDVQAVLIEDLIARVVAQTSRQSGLSIVYTELLNFGGDEIYFKQEPGLVGKTYGEALHAYEDSSLMGMRKSDGRILLSPPMDTMIEKDDRIFAMSEDDDTIHLSNLTPIPINGQAIRSSITAAKLKPEKCLIIGWNHSGMTIVRELDNYVPKGSSITVASDIYGIDKEIKRQGIKLQNQKLLVEEGETTDRDLLDKLGVEEYDHVIVLANSGLDHQEADARTLVTLLHLRNMAGHDAPPFSIVSEMLDIQNRELAEVTQVDDFIVSEHLVSLMMSQLSENAELFEVFTDIFDPEGTEIYLKPIDDYVRTGEPVNFYTVVEAARRRGETAIGYRIISESKDASKSYGVHTNPKKSEKVVFAPEDRIIVAAEN